MRHVTQRRLASGFSPGPRYRASISARALWGLLALVITLIATATPAMADAVMDWNQTGGIHYRTSLVVSDEMGRKIAAYLVANTMKPAR